MLSQISKAETNPVAISVSGKVSGREYTELCDLLSRALQTRKTVDLLCELDASFRGVSLPLLLKAAFVASESVIKLRRVAVIGEPKSYKWARVLVRAFHADTCYFQPAHRTRARQWLEKGGGSVETGLGHKLAGDASYRTQQRNPRSQPRNGQTPNHRRDKRDRFR